MTRETKIGLLVGLAFIIVIGILLSDHLTTSTEPPQAPLAQAGNSVRAAVGQPASANPPITTVGTRTNVAPLQPVVTQNELTKPQANQIIKIATPADPNQTVAANDQSGNAGVPNQLAETAKQHSEELVAVGGNGNGQNVDLTPATSNDKIYVAQAGDSLSKMATKFFGTNNKANRAAIIAANPVLKDNPNMVIVGKEYNIPAGATTVATSGNETTTGLGLRPAAPVQTVAATPSSSEHMYTVKSGDTLTRIASEQADGTASVTTILNLNKDVLKDANKLRAGMKLRLPAKTIASAR